MSVSCLESPGLGRNRFGCQRLHLDRLVLQTAAFREPQGVTQPVFVVTFWVVVQGMSTATFSTIGGRLRGGASHFDHVGHFQSFNTGGIEHFGLVFEVNVLDFGNQGFDLVDTLVQQIQGTEHAAVSLHGHTNLVAHVLCLFARCTGFQTVDAVQRVLDGGLVDFLVRVRFLGVRIHKVVAGSATEHDQVQQGVRTQTVGTVHGSSGTFTDGVQTVDDLVLARWRLGHNLTVVVRGDTAHLVVDGWNHRDWVFDRVHVTELDRDFANRGQTFLDDV